MLNPGGSVKDRVAVEIVREALDSGELKCGGLITEGTVGSTGVSLAMVGAAHTLVCFFNQKSDRPHGAELVNRWPRQLGVDAT